MTVDLRHLFVSPVASTNSSRLVQGPNWNEGHNLQQGPAALLGRSDAAAGQAATQEIQLDPSLGFVGGRLAALAGGPPSGAAGGDLVGTYPNPTLKDIKTPSQFGAKGDGVTDDTIALNAFLASGGNLQWGPGTYIVSGSGLSGVSNTTLRFVGHPTIDFRLATTPGSPNSPWSGVTFGLAFNGTIGTPVLLSADAAAGQANVVVPNATVFAVDEWVYLASNALFEIDTSTRIGQFAQVKAINTGTNTLSMYENLYLSYNMVDGASIKTTKNYLHHIHVSGDATFLGNYAGIIGQGAILFRYCRDFSLRDVTTLRTDYTGAQTYKSHRGYFENVKNLHDSAPGGNVGLMHVYGSADIKHVSCFADGFCHHIDVSGDTSTGGVTEFISATQCTSANSTGAAYNTHPGAGRGIDYSHNTVTMMTGLNSSTPTGMCGIRCQGPQFTAIGNRCYNVTGSGIFHQVETTQPVPIAATIIGNRGYAQPNQATDYPGSIGVLVQGFATPSTVGAVVVQGNEFYGFGNGCVVFANNMNFDHVLISNNVFETAVTPSSGSALIQIRAGAGHTVNSAVVANNICKFGINTVGNGIYLLGADLGSISDVSVTGNACDNVNFAIRYEGVSNFFESNTTATNLGTRKFFTGNDANNGLVVLDRRDANIVTTTSVVTYTVLEQDAEIIVNRAGNVALLLPSASVHKGRIIRVRTLQAQTVTSTVSNIVPVIGGTAGTAILPATAGAYATLKSDGTNWLIVSRSVDVTANPQNAQTGNYTAVLADAGATLYHAVAAAAATYTIPANTSVAYPIGTTLTFVNDSANAVTIAITTDTLVLSPGTTTGSRTLATGGVATALKVTATRWVINGTGLS